MSSNMQSGSEQRESKESRESQSSQGGPQYPSQVTELALRSAGQFLDMQMTTMRTLLQTQARAAAALGFPDLSNMFKNSLERPMRDVLSKGTEQLVSSTQRANETVAELQRQVGQIVETQVTLAAQNWQHGLEELGAQTDESLKQLRATAQQQAEQLERTTRTVAETTRSSMREGSDQLRQQIQEGGQRTRESLSQAGEQQRQTAEQQRQSIERQGAEAASKPHSNQPSGGEEKQKRERVNS